MSNNELKRGSVIRAECMLMGIIPFDHYGIYAGEKMVIHYRDGLIRQESIKKFVEDSSTIDVMGFSSEHTKKYTLEMSYERASRHIGHEGYDVFSNNCEHFALWCRTGKAVSGQAFGSESTHGYATVLPNIPRLIGFFTNSVGMKKSRSISMRDL